MKHKVIKAWHSSGFAEVTFLLVQAAKSMATDQASRLPPRSGPSAMGPPASRPAPGPRAATPSVGSAPGIVLRRTDSQRTKIGRNQSVAPEPAGQSNASSGMQLNPAGESSQLLSIVQSSGF